MAALLLTACNPQQSAQADAEKATCAAVPNYSGPDEVAGVRLGMALADTRALLKCRDGGFRFKEDSGGFTVPSLPDGTRPVSKLVAQRGTIEGCNPADASTLKTCMADDPTFRHVDELVNVYFAGLPGQEKAIAVMREETFPAGNHASSAVERDLTAKYGAQPEQNGWGSSRRYAWLFDGRGQRVSAQNPDFALCRDASGFGSDAPSELRRGCRRTVTAWIDSGLNEPGIAASYGVALVDQEAASSAVERAKAQISGGLPDTDPTAPHAGGRAL